MENEKQFDVTESGERIFNVPAENLPQLRERIEKLNKKAAKLGTAPILVTVLETVNVPMTKSDNVLQRSVTAMRKVHKLTVTGQAPKLNGWEFIAVLEQVADEEGKSLGNILRAVPGASCEVPLKYRDAESKCDHCKTSRRRNDTFILKNEETSVTRQVGRNCLKDFLGHASPELYCSLAEMLMSAEDFAEDSENDRDCGIGRIEHYDAEEILQLAACSIRLNGWRSNKTAQEFGKLSTSGEVGNWIHDTNRQKWEKPLIPSDEDKATAKEVVSWLATLTERVELNDYMYNLSLLGRGATFTGKNFGLACSAIPTYLREMEREINRRKRFAEDAASVHVGTVGEKIEKLTATLVFTRDIEKAGYAYGVGTVTHMYKFKDDAGNILVWFASNVYWNPETKQDINVGDTVTLTGTVKNHDEYQGVKQTIITRCKEWKSKETKKAEAKARKAERELQKENNENTDLVS